MKDIILILIILAILAVAITKIVIAKRRGDKCIGCPYGQNAIHECKCDEQE